MADFAYNISKGKVKYYCELPAANDALVLMLYKTTGIEADNTRKDYDTISAELAAANDEATATNYARKTITSVTVTVDDTNDRVDIDFADQTWTALGGASNHDISDAVVAYDPDTTGGTDADLIPLTNHDFVVTTDGSDVTLQVAAAGFFRAA